MKTKKMFITFILSLMILSTATTVQAELLPIEPCGIEEDSSTYASDIIEYVYRVYEGRLQYRRWNSTKGYWIDATWLDA